MVHHCSLHSCDSHLFPSEGQWQSLRLFEDPWLRDQPEWAGRDFFRGLSHSAAFGRGCPYWKATGLLSLWCLILVGSFQAFIRICSSFDTSDIGIAGKSIAVVCVWRQLQFWELDSFVRYWFDSIYTGSGASAQQSIQGGYQRCRKRQVVFRQPELVRAIRLAWYRHNSRS